MNTTWKIILGVLLAVCFLAMVISVYVTKDGNNYNKIQSYVLGICFAIFCALTFAGLMYIAYYVGMCDMSTHGLKILYAMICNKPPPSMRDRMD